MRKAIGALIGAFVFAMLTFLSLYGGVLLGDMIPGLIIVWSVPGALIGFVLAAEKGRQNFLRRKAPLVGAGVLGVPNLLVTVNVVHTGGEATLLLIFWDTPVWGLFRLSWAYSSLQGLLMLFFVLSAFFMWGAIGAAFVALAQGGE